VNDTDARARVMSFLLDQGLVTEGEEPVMTPLDGGVSSDLWKVEARDRTICVKGALARLRVAREWRAPVSRNHVEYEYLRFADGVAPGQVPRVLAHDKSAGLFAMEYLPPESHPVWKTQLLRGRTGVEVAAAVGDLVGRLHAASTVGEALAVRFATDDNFDALRIQPFFRDTAASHGGLAKRFAHLAERTAETHVALVHGDVSPKNILLGPDGPVLLDAECAWFGDPAFDVAFCVSHLLLKSVKLPMSSPRLLEASLLLAAAHSVHVSWEPATSCAERVATLLPALALARVDGTSPVEYLDESQRQLVRAAGRTMMGEPVSSVAEALEQWALLTSGQPAAS
jgi:aminoglycoside phosphotransferase (APT) family kinase protein